MSRIEGRRHMIKRVKKVGNSHAVFLDKPLMDLVGIEDGSEIQLTVHDGAIVIAPVNPRAVPEEEVDRLLDKVVDTRADALKRLAE